MKKLLISLFVSSIIFSSSFAQEWEKIKIDSIVSLEMPTGFSVSDTLNQKIYSSPIPFGTMMAIKTSNDTVVSGKIDSKKKLSEFYDNYINNIETLAKGTIQDERDTTINNFVNKIFTLQIDTMGFVELRHFHVIFTNEAIYTFEFLNRKNHEELSAESRNQFFSSITLPQQPQRNTTQIKKENKDNKVVPEWLYYAAGLLFILLIIIVIRSPKRKT